MNIRTVNTSKPLARVTDQSQGPIEGAKNREYCIFDDCIINWASYGGDDYVLINVRGTLDALLQSNIPFYQALYEQASQFFKEVAASLTNGDIPATLSVKVPRAGRTSMKELGTFYHVKYHGMQCVIPALIMVGEWRHVPVRH